MSQLEIFCGTGGVGKTTLSYCRALSLAESGKKTLILTIDPSHRLKDFINEKSLDNLTIKIVEPKTIFARILQKQELPKNRILDLLMSNYAGMNEILSLVELQEILGTEKYDKVILDTAPGGHFIDFLESTQKIKSFFSKTFIDLLAQFNPSDNAKKKTNLFKSIVQSGLEKLLSYLEKVTGGTFIQEFLDSISILYGLKDKFLKTLELQEKLFDSQKCSWFLVTSADQRKYFEVKAMVNNKNFAKTNTFAIINKSNSERLKKEVEFTPDQSPARGIINHYLRNENSLIDNIRKDFENVVTFEEVISNNLSEQIDFLKEEWKKNEL